MATRKSARTRKRDAETKASNSQDESSKVVWEWEGDGGKWSKYDDAHAAEITKALKGGEDSVTLQVTPTVIMSVRFSSMTQMNVSTGWQRNIRCFNSGCGQWEWQDEHSKWNSYSPTVQRLLVACAECGVSEREIEAAGRNYTVDLANKKQTNKETKVERDVRCTGGTGEASTSKKAKPSEASTSKKAKPSEASTSKKAKPSEASTSKKAKSSEASTSKKAKSSEASTSKKAKSSEASTSKKAKSSDSEEPPPAAKPTRGDKSSASKSTSKPSSSKASLGEEEDTGRTVVATKGAVPVDYACTQKVSKAHVYCEGGEYWDAMLNQTNLKNNNNKFYILQLLEDDGSAKKYSVWFRWGRVGKTGQSSLQVCGSDLDQAKNLFTKKFSDKTHNSWDDRDNFETVAGKYDLLKIDYEAEDETDEGVESVDGVGGGEESGTDEDKKPPVSKLDPTLQSLIELICNVKAMEEMVVEMKYDAKKAPLGKLTTEQIRSGYAALKKIEDCINKSDFGDHLYKACDEFYTRIPHSFGMQRPPVIKTRDQIKEKITLLEALGDIQIAMKVLSGGSSQDQEHPIDRHYSDLKCQLSPVDSEDGDFALVDKYLRQTHARTHNQYTLELLDLFEVDRAGERESFKDVGNRKLLWHGSRLTNWVGILSQGLRIAPPEAPVTGYMFGKGIYFADMSSKSANYCFASRSKNEGLILLCDVSLGHTNDLLAADYSADQLPRGKHSVMGLGKVAPNPSMDHKLSDGCVVPLGTSVDTGVNNPRGYTLNYNEYIVYDTKQVKMKYLAKVRFNFK